ncbi:KIF-binding protein isoform X3 [Linepithema humile]|uniref:KIF-binding protein isoform X3 n=1 Tax=Linepithema humile TaxID=83485 RepID=UPI0006232ACB|nr:PREDICTED: uncharacterized protein LOC105679816 isoform X2 [Linepithema humile]
MDYFLDKYTEQRIEQISSQSVSNKEVTSAESIKDVDVDKKFLKVIKSLFELKKQQTNEFSKKNKLIHTIKIRIDRLFKDVTTSKNTKFDNIVVLAIANYYMGTIYTEDPKSEKLYSLSIAEVYYKRCLKLLKEKELERKAIVITIRVLDELYEISYKREQSEKSYSVLNTAMELYSEYTKGEIEYPDPIDLTVILGVNFEEVQNPKVLLEQLHLNILKNLSYLYLDYSEKYRRFVVCIHDILSKRIKETMSSNENIIFWAITSLELSCYFLHNYLFTEARNHIAAAEYMTNIFQINARTKNQENPILHINLCKLYEIVRGYISRCWAAYGVQLLHKSEERLLPRKEDD